MSEKWCHCLPCVIFFGAGAGADAAGRATDSREDGDFSERGCTGLARALRCSLLPRAGAAVRSGEVHERPRAPAPRSSWGCVQPCLAPTASHTKLLPGLSRGSIMRPIRFPSRQVCRLRLLEFWRGASSPRSLRGSADFALYVTKTFIIHHDFSCVPLDSIRITYAWHVIIIKGSSSFHAPLRLRRDGLELAGGVRAISGKICVDKDRLGYKPSTVTACTPGALLQRGHPP